MASIRNFLIALSVMTVGAACGSTSSPKPAANPGQIETTTSTAVETTTSTVAVVSYANCAAVKAAGKAPLQKGEPGYSSALDRDGDGTACDTKMTFAECQTSAEYTTESGATGQYTVDFDNGVCTVQR